MIRHLLGKEDVFRLNPTVPTGAVSLDSVDTDALNGLAGHVSRDASPAIDRLFCGHRAPAFIPFYPLRGV